MSTFRLARLAIVLALGVGSVASIAWAEQLPEEYQGSWEKSAYYSGFMNTYYEYEQVNRTQMIVIGARAWLFGGDLDTTYEFTFDAQPASEYDETWTVQWLPDYDERALSPFADCPPFVDMHMWTTPLVQIIAQKVSTKVGEVQIELGSFEAQHLARQGASQLSTTLYQQVDTYNGSRYNMTHDTVL